MKGGLLASFIRQVPQWSPRPLPPPREWKPRSLETFARIHTYIHTEAGTPRGARMVKARKEERGEGEGEEREEGTNRRQGNFKEPFEASRESLKFFR